MNTLLKKTTELMTKPQGSVNLIDIDYKLLEDPDDPYTTSTRSMIETNYNALLNSYRLWLQSRPGDYIRDKDTGGMFTYALNDKVPFREDSIETIKEMVMTDTRRIFPELAVLSVDVKRIVETRTWDISIAVQDTLTDNVMVTGLSVEGAN